jgi:hypothetical protein
MFLLVLASLLALMSGGAEAQTGGCSFSLGFADLHTLLPDVVGDCLSNAVAEPNGDVQQQTTNGLLAWRKADNWTAFTNGSTTWINGPDGVQSRPNDQRFSWEPVAPPATASVPTPGPVLAGGPPSRDSFGVLYVPSASIARGDSVAVAGQAAAAGARWIRFQLDRGAVHKGPGQFDWSAFDPVIDQVSGHGGKLLVILCCSPNWDSAAPPDTPAGRRWAYLPPAGDLGPWREYVRAVATRYRGRVQAYEAWNEPDPNQGGTAAENAKAASPAEFAALVAATAQEVRAADPGALVVGSGFRRGVFLAGGQYGDWFRQFWADAAHPPAQSLDVVSFHLIAPLQPHQRALDDAQAITAELRRDYQWSKPIWLTEVGYSSLPKFQEPAYQGEQGQAQWLADTLPGLLQRGVDKLFWAALQDLGARATVTRAYGGNGLFDAQGQPKAAWNAFLNVLAGFPAG